MEVINDIQFFSGNVKILGVQNENGFEFTNNNMADEFERCYEYMDNSNILVLEDITQRDNIPIEMINGTIKTFDFAFNRNFNSVLGFQNYPSCSTDKSIEICANNDNLDAFQNEIQINVKETTMEGIGTEEYSNNEIMVLSPQYEEVYKKAPIEDNVDETIAEESEELDKETHIEDNADDFLAEGSEEVDNDVPKKRPKKLSITERRNLTKKNRLRGKQYTGYERSRENIVTHKTVRAAKTIKERCCHREPKKELKNSFLCYSISEEDRKNMFSSFWKLGSWGEKKVFVRGLVNTRPVRRRRKIISESEENFKKSQGHDYFLKTISGNRIKVCRLLFVNTLGLGEDSLKRWIKETDSNSSTSNSDTSSQSFSIVENMRVKSQETRRSIERKQVTETVVTWLSSIPKVPSHYCRASSNMKYVDNEFISKNNMYKIFKNWCLDEQKKAAHLKLFKTVLTTEKIAIHKPRKDQCDTCVGHKCGTVSEENYIAHQQKKDAAKVAKDKFINSANDELLVFTMDLQSVLTCPRLLASQSYYKLKLQVHNFTIYAQNDAHVNLYVWHEANGGVTCNEFTSCLIDYLSNIQNNYKSVIMISDGCNYQNRNKTLSSALSDLAKEKNITIQQLFLEKGHTMMSADTVHSTLEHYFTPPIFSPSDYLARMRLARSTNPYEIKHLDYTFFKKYELPSNFDSIRPGKRVRDPVVVDIRQLKYLPNGEVYFTLDYSEEWTVMPRRRENQKMEVYKEQLYKNQLPISDDKYKHLQELKSVMELDHHAFYDALPHQQKKKK